MYRRRVSSSRGVSSHRRTDVDEDLSSWNYPGRLLAKREDHVSKTSRNSAELRKKGGRPRHTTNDTRRARLVYVFAEDERIRRRDSINVPELSSHFRRAIGVCFAIGEQTSWDIPPVRTASLGKVSLGASPAGTTIPPDPRCFIIHAPSSRNGNLPLVSSSFRCRNAHMLHTNRTTESSCGKYLAD